MTWLDASNRAGEALSGSFRPLAASYSRRVVGRQVIGHREHHAIVLA
jgi:hypothetical protein